jgi:hypothetical protein
MEQQFDFSKVVWYKKGMNNFLEISSNFLIISCVLLLWFNIMVDLIGEMGTYISLSISTIGIFFSFPLYFIEYFITGSEFRYSVAGYIFMFFSAFYLFVIYGAFFFQHTIKKNVSLLDKLAKKYDWSS